MGKVYFHIDLNAFFASAEVLLDPSLKGLPVAVGGNSRRSVVSTCSYEARAFGVHSAMPMHEALNRCPKLVVRQSHFTFYQTLSEQFMELIRSYSKEMEVASIDECYVDVTEKIMTYENPLDLAYEIQKRVNEELGLQCSIGIAPNMFLAKMASDMKKPMGITVLRIKEVPQKLWPLPIEEMRGCGKKRAPQLIEMGIKTIGDLAHIQNPLLLKPIFGKNSEMMIQRANGIDHQTIVTDYDAKSISVSETLLEDITDYEEIRGMFRHLSRKLSRRLSNDQKLGTLISIRIRYRDFQTVERSKKLDRAIWKQNDLFYHAMGLFQDHWNEEPVRLLGISMSHFVSDGYVDHSIDLFNYEEALKEETICVISDLQKLVGDGKSLSRASDLLKKKL